jgi:hypothetical protein
VPDRIASSRDVPLFVPSRYLVWAGPRDYKTCDTLAEALSFKEKYGGTIYEPLGAREAEKLTRESKPGNTPLEPGTVTCTRCRKNIKGTAALVYRDCGEARRPYHKGCLERLTRTDESARRRQAERRRNGQTGEESSAKVHPPRGDPP